MDLLNAAVTQGFITEAQKLELIKTAIDGASNKLAAIEAAIKAQTLSFIDKMNLLNEAVNAGFITQAENLDLIKKAIDGASNKLAAIEEAINAQTLSLEQKIALLNEAVSAGFITQTENLDLIKKAIEGTSNKLAAIEEAINAQTLSLAAKMDLLNTAVTQGFINEAQKLALIEDAIKALDNSGIYRDENDNSSIYMKPDVWAAIKNEPNVANEILKTMEEFLPTVETVTYESDGQTVHGPGAVTRVSYDPFELYAESLVKKVIKGKEQELMKIIKIAPAATYKLDRAGCSHSIISCTVTDADGQKDIVNPTWDTTQFKINFINATTGSLRISASVVVIVNV